MKRNEVRKYFIAAIVSLFAGLTLLVPTFPARANETPVLDFASCSNLKNWSPNEDEQDRRPTPTVDGLQFEGNQLVHHPVAMDLKDVHPGTYAATPAPSLVDFFSIEVYSPAAPHGYATLRYEAVGPNAGQWNIGGTNFYGTDAVQLVLDHDRSTNVVSFGVGYVANPATGTKTIVSSVTFHGVTYPLTCKPAPSKTPTSPTVKPSSSKSPGAGVHTIPNPPQNGPALAVTGPDGRVIGVGAAVLALLGAALLVIARRRKTHFRA